MEHITLTNEAATEEVDHFLFEVKKLNKDLVFFDEDKSESYEKLIKLTELGMIAFTEDNIKVRLQVPIGDFEELELKPRLQASNLAKLDRIKAKNVTEKTLETMAMLIITEGMNKVLLKKLDTVDFGVISNIIPFYF